MTVAGGLFLGLGLLPAQAFAAVTVNCGAPRASINTKLNSTAKNLVIVVKGNCVENVRITRDDVTIQTDGINPASITPADATKDTIVLDGAHRVVVDGIIANGLTITGGTTGVSATRGSTLTMMHCAVTGAAVNGIVSSYGSTTIVDQCDVHDNPGNGIVAANSASVVVTNTTVHHNNGNGIIAVRSSNARIGQDASGSAVLGPVTVNDNGLTGVVVSEGAAGTLLATTVQSNGAGGVFVGRTSEAQIGVGSNNVTGSNTISGNTGTGVNVRQASQARIQGATIENNTGNGVSLAGGSATITASTISSNGGRGIEVTESGGARIGVTDSGLVSGNTIQSNGYDGVGVFNGAMAVLGKNEIASNAGVGVNVGRAMLRMVGQNVIESNVGHGVSVVQSTLYQAQGDWTGISPNLDTIQNNGRAGLSLFNTSSADVEALSVSGNHDRGIEADLNSSIWIKNSTVSGNGTGGTYTDGVGLFMGSALWTVQSGSGLTIDHHAGWGIRCGDGESSRAGDLSGVLGAVPGGNALGQTNCTGF